jgi:hypothetical protein
MREHKRDPRTWRELWQMLGPVGRARLIALAVLIALATATILAAAL